MRRGSRHRPPAPAGPGPRRDRTPDRRRAPHASAPRSARPAGGYASRGHAGRNARRGHWRRYAARWSWVRLLEEFHSGSAHAMKHRFTWKTILSQPMDEYRSPIGSRRLPPLAALRTFEAAARHQSFRAAADELAVTATAVSHQIRQLEQRLGVVLFERQARGVVLTMEGRRLFPALREGFELMAAALAPLLQPKRRRIVTVSATPAFMARLLVPQLASFQATHREFDLRLHASTRPVDFAAQQIDAAI